MDLDHAVVRRLAFIKYLYREAMAQSRAPSPLNCASLLMMHDAVELFLQLASEHLNAGSNAPGFMEYWDLLNRKLDPGELEQKESMRRLNKARVALKHHGTFPSLLDIESFRASVTWFFVGNMQLVFGCALDDVSLIEFVNPESARAKLKEAERLIKGGDTLAALDGIASGFAEMIADYENRKRDRFHSSPFNFGRSMTFLSSFHIGLGIGAQSSAERKLGEFIDAVTESIEAMQDAIKMLSLGIDYRKYSRFKMLTPRVLQVESGSWRVLCRDFDEANRPAESEALFCLDFTVESALALSEFDYTVGAGKGV